MSIYEDPAAFLRNIEQLESDLPWAKIDRKLERLVETINRCEEFIRSGKAQAVRDSKAKWNAGPIGPDRAAIFRVEHAEALAFDREQQEIVLYLQIDGEAAIGLAMKRNLDPRPLAIYLQTHASDDAIQALAFLQVLQAPPSPMPPTDQDAASTLRSSSAVTPQEPPSSNPSPTGQSPAAAVEEDTSDWWSVTDAARETGRAKSKVSGACDAKPPRLHFQGSGRARRIEPRSARRWAAECEAKGKAKDDANALRELRESKRRFECTNCEADWEANEMPKICPHCLRTTVLEVRNVPERGKSKKK